jgi:F-type H+-transporting ATPase subunit gamma
MANLKEIRNRISSVNSTKQITSAMKMVSASKLKRAQNAVEKMRPFSERLSTIIQNVSANSGEYESAFSESREVKNVLIVSIASNRGLCGAFNANVIKKVKALIQTTYSGSEVTVYSIGKKSADAFKKTFNHQLDKLPDQPSSIYDDLTFNRSAEISKAIMEAYVDGVFDKVVLVYNSFKNAAMQILKEESFLPIETNTEVEAASIDYIYEPNEEEILLDLIPQSLNVQLFKALLDSHASEHGARMTAMHKATDNAEELLGNLRLTYNKLRQASITNEILEIVSGAEALKG